MAAKGCRATGLHVFDYLKEMGGKFVVFAVLRTVKPKDIGHL